MTFLRALLLLVALPFTPELRAEEVPPPGSEAYATALLHQLVAVDTSSGRGNVPSLAADLASRLRRGGFASQDVTVVPVGDTAALVARYRGNGSGGRPIALMGHLDVVAARSEDWGRNPFELAQTEGYLVGRGTLDVKGEIALLVTTLLGLKAEGFVPTRDIILILTGDEETTGDTAEVLAKDHRNLIDAEFALNADNLGGGTLDEKSGQPILFRVQGSEKASARFQLRTRNAGGHSSQPRSDNAIYELADALKAVERFRFPLRWNEWTLGDFAGTGPTIGGTLGKAMVHFSTHPGDPDAATRISEESAFIGRLRTTCVATLLQGGHAANALPQSATATLSCRIFPGDSMQFVHDQLKQIVGSKVDVIDGPPVAAAAFSPLRPDVMAAVSAAVEATHPGARVIPTQSSYATDGSTFRLAGIPTYGVGGLFIKESEQFAHGLNERIPERSFNLGLAYWNVLIRKLTSPGHAN